MNIEEARNTLKSLKQYYNDKNEDSYVGFDNEDNEALDMASRALEVVQVMEEVFLQELPELDMREATEEERSSLKRYIDSISKSTGVKFDFNSINTELKPCEDCVSREAIKEKKVYSEERHEYIVPVAEIDWLPSVKPQRPPGKWLDKKMTIKGAHGMAYGRYACSVCKKKFPNKSNYCPDCGAEMEGSNGE